MSFDPDWPQNHTVADADKMREQLNGLKAIAEAIPGITGVEVDSVVTLEGDHAATVSVTLIGTTLHFSFGIPRGHDGAAGENGATGPQGETGVQGEPGPTGEVSQVALENAIAGTSSNSNSVATLDDPFAHPRQNRCGNDSTISWRR
jgi:hypothetical protein